MQAARAWLLTTVYTVDGSLTLCTYMCCLVEGGKEREAGPLSLVLLTVCKCLRSSLACLPSQERERNEKHKAGTSGGQL